MDNQQQSTNLKFTGKTIKPEHYYLLIEEYTNGDSLMQLSNKYGYNIATIRYFLKNNDIKTRTVKESIAKFQKEESGVDEFLEQNLIG